MPHASSSTSEPMTPWLDYFNNAPANIEGLPVKDEPIIEEPHEEAQSLPGLAMVGKAALDEWQRQNYQVHENENIHHFNFLGDGVPCKNATPPACLATCGSDRC